MTLKDDWDTGDVVTAADINAISAQANATELVVDAITATGSAVVTAADAAAARAAIGAGTSSLTLGTTAGTAKAGDYAPTSKQLRRSRPGVVRRVLAPGNLSWLDSLIRVYYDDSKFFTDFNVTQYRHTGTRWYSDRENGANTNSGRGSTLTTALVAGTAVTSLAVTSLPATFPSGSKIVVAAQDQAGVWRSIVATLSAEASSAATSISVNSVTPTFSFPVGALVANPVQTVYKAYSSASASDQLIPLDRSSNTFGGILDRTSTAWGFGEMAVAATGTTTSNISTGSPITSVATSALTVAISSGSSITLTSGANLQTFIASATASVGATSISVTSQTPNFAFPSGTSVQYGNRIAKSITIAPQFPGEVKLVVGDWHGSGGSSTWALKSTFSNVYIVTRSGALRVVDSGIGQYGMEYARVANATACEALPGSYYVSGSEVGVHYISGGTPDAKRVHVLISTSEITTVRNENGAMSVYLEGFTIIGGGQGNLWAENTGMGNLDLYGADMNFLWAAGTGSGADSVNADGVRYCFFQRCRAHQSPKDGFNYASRDRGSVLRNAPKFIEVDCESWAHGIGNPIVSFTNVNNASTAHEGAQGLRIGGSYHQTTGAVLADVQTGTETWNANCDVWGSLSTVDDYDTAIDAQQSGATMHVWACRAFDAKYDIAVRAGTTVNVYDSEYETTLGTITVVSSV